ncbi:BLUF domain-containing protein [Marimonas lutisalis]|uniref:BLUF domain-containing protein n=1 Tax=Marimonas lutisalis TaxID=2545756 RepID=UPI0013754B1C|nr:BLUF domain-containing protein [Marimonas lutisalis]
MTHYLIYRSDARHPFPHLSDFDILRTAWAHNQRVGISGYLVRTMHEFFQILEGPREELDRLYTRISADERHSNVRLLSEGPLARRRFPNWAMGYAEAVEDDPAASLFAKGLPDQDVAQLIKSFEELAAARGAISGRAALLRE